MPDVTIAIDKIDSMQWYNMEEFEKDDAVQILATAYAAREQSGELREPSDIERQKQIGVQLKLKGPG